MTGRQGRPAGWLSRFAAAAKRRAVERRPDFDTGWIAAANARLSARRAGRMAQARADARPWVGGGGGDR